MPDLELSRYYPATPDETFTALVNTVQELAKFQSSDDFSRSVAFATKMTGWASGSNISASVRPEGGEGCTVRLEGQAKMRSQVNANNAAHKQLVAILDRTADWIQHARLGSD
jgi:hypothetical protein